VGATTEKALMALGFATGIGIFCSGVLFLLKLIGLSIGWLTVIAPATIPLSIVGVVFILFLMTIRIF
jgi:hypothetical protein